jgi:HD-like signal output (HDOD) protein
MSTAAAIPVSSQPTPHDLVRELTHLPSAPRVLPRLKELLSDGNSSMHDVVALVRLDPAIAARVLQMGNSAYFGQGLRCSTVDEAVNRVGYAQIYDLVSYAVASQVLVRPLAVYGLEIDELWRMSVVCALAAETLAVQTGQDRDVAYTVGLLHCLGMVVIDEWALRQQAKLVLPSRGMPREATEAERAALGFTQAEAGAVLLRHWDFPHAMCAPVRWQYAPRSCASHPRMACLLQCAKWLRAVVCGGDAAGGLPPLPPASVLQMLPLRPAELPKLAGGVRQRLEEVSSLLEPSGKTRGAGTAGSRFPAAPAA